MSLGTLASLSYFIPEIILVFTIMSVVTADLILKNRRSERRLVIVMLSLLGLLFAGYYAVQLSGSPEGSLFSQMVAQDGFGNFLRIIFIATAIFVLLFTVPSKELARVPHGELLALLLTVTVSLIWMANSINLLMIYLTLETVSVASYIMVGYLKDERPSNEASLKYILFGAVSTGTMLFGMSLLFGLTGSLDIYSIQAALAAQDATQSGGALMFIVVLVLAGIGFKMAAVPFHFWCPDVYTGAPTPVTALLSIGPKVAGFAVLVRFFVGGMSQAGGDGTWQMVGGVDWQMLLIAISVVSMTVGNIAALLQTNMKRLLAYSSIAHAGYIMMGAVVMSTDGIQAMLAYILIYLFMNLGAFLVVIIMHNGVGSFELADYAGIWRRAPILTIAMGVFLFSLMGIPPFAGFLAKWYVFAAVVSSDLAWFAVVGAINSAIAAFYYMKVLKVMVIDGSDSPEPALPLEIHPLYGGLLLVLVVPNILGLLFLGQIDRVTELSQKLLEVM